MVRDDPSVFALLLRPGEVCRGDCVEGVDGCDQMGELFAEEREGPVPDGVAVLVFVAVVEEVEQV